jgi:hypothetical protein
MFEVEVNHHGPIFDGRAEVALTAFLVDAQHEIAQEGAEDVRRELRPGHGYRTGAYRSHVQAHLNRVDDGGSVYGPWLEGVSHRNQTTRFKGYHTFRQVAQRLQEKAGVIAERVLQKYLGRMQ